MLSDGHHSTGKQVVVASATVLAILLALGAWWLLRQPALISPLVAARNEAPRKRPVAHRTALPSVPTTVVETPAKRGPAPLEYASDGVPFMPASGDDPHPKTYVHPHPITPAHLRIYRENNLLYQLNEAMDGREVSRLRGLIKVYRDEYPEDPHAMQGGYTLIADCIEFPGDPTTRASAQRYFSEEIASTLRRFVLRHCLSGR